MDSNTHSLGFEATEHLRNMMRKENCWKRNVKLYKVIVKGFIVYRFRYPLRTSRFHQMTPLFWSIRHSSKARHDIPVIRNIYTFSLAGKNTIVLLLSPLTWCSSLFNIVLFFLFPPLCVMVLFCFSFQFVLDEDFVCGRNISGLFKKSGIYSDACICNKYNVWRWTPHVLNKELC